MNDFTVYHLNNLTSNSFNKILKDLFAFPLHDFNFLKFLSNFYSAKCEIVVFNKEPKCIVIYLIKQKDDLNFLITQGRFGTLGIINSQINNKITNFDFERLISFLNQRNVHISSISFNPLSYIRLKNLTKYQFSTQKYYVCNIKRVFKEQPNSKYIELYKNHKLRKSIKNSAEKGYYCLYSNTIQSFKDWYYNCYLERMNHISGKIWDYNFLLNIFRNKKAKLLTILSPKKEICGGVLFFEIPKIIEILMFSVTTKSQIDDASNYLANFIYNYANKKNVKYINWQRSSNYNVGIFKIKWKCEVLEVPTFHYISKSLKPNDITQSFLKNNFKDLFVYPYQLLCE